MGLTRASRHTITFRDIPAPETLWILSALVGIQGASHFAQLGASLILSPEQYGVIRTAESCIGLALLLATAGPVQLALAKQVPLGQAGGLGAVRACAVASLLPAIGAALYLCRLSPSYALYATIVPIAAAIRTMNSQLQAQHLVGLAGWISISTALLGAPAILLATYFAGLAGWFAARIATDLAGAYRYLQARTGDDDEPLAATKSRTTNLWKTVTDGYVLSSALAIRYFMDNAPLLIVAQLKSNSSLTSQLGLSTNILTLCLLVSAALTTRFTTRIADALPGGGRATSCYVRDATLAAAAASGLLAILAASAAFWADARDIGVFSGAGYTVALFCAAAPFRATAGMCGAFLTACSRRREQVYINLALAFFLLALIIPGVALEDGGWIGAAYATSEATGAVVYWQAAHRAPRVF